MSGIERRGVRRPAQRERSLRFLTPRESISKKVAEGTTPSGSKGPLERAEAVEPTTCRRVWERCIGREIRVSNVSSQSRSCQPS